MKTEFKDALAQLVSEYLDEIEPVDIEEALQQELNEHRDWMKGRVGKA